MGSDAIKTGTRVKMRGGSHGGLIIVVSRLDWVAWILRGNILGLLDL